MPRRLTDRYLSTLKPPASGRTEVVDSEARGLVFRLAANGRASWALRFTHPRTRKQERHTIGDYPAVSLAKAREQAVSFRANLLDGKDPRKDALDTVADLLDEYHRRYVVPNTRKPEQTRALYDQHVIPTLGTMRLTDLRRGDVVDLLDRLQDKGMKAQTNRVQSALSAALNWAVDAGHLTANPILGLKHRFKESPRDRVLTDDELRAVWQAAGKRTAPSREFMQVLILTVQRRDEVRGMRWDELDEQARAWTIPANRNKANRAHLVPLSDLAWETIDGLPRLGPYVFTTDGERPYNGHSKIGPALRKASGVDGWTLHDLRRTGRTGLSRLGVSPLVAELILNHAREDLERVYDRHAFTDEKRDALEKWADHVRRIAETTAGANVVALR